jgi:hypothetical protein
LVLILLAGCAPAHEEELDHPEPIPVDPIHPRATDPLEIVYTTTPRGVEVEAPRYMIERGDLWLVALDEIDREVWPTIPGWVVVITKPDGVQKADASRRRVYVRWRKDGHRPKWITLPGLRLLVEEAAARASTSPR